MALDRDNFDPTGSGSKGSAPKIHTYTTDDNIADVEGANYFDALEGIISTGDVIYADMGNGAKFYRATNTSGAISISTALTFA